jgi:cytosine/adenosine deaminase-related metal-dependent hydrolase
VLLPGLVNAHTHLQYTSFDQVGAAPHSDYTAWSVAFVDEYDRRTGEDWVAAARRGAAEMLAAGITCIGDIVTDFVARDVLVEAGIPGVAYLELIGVDAEMWHAGTADRLREAILSAPTTAVTRVGISPHAPYSVDEPVISAMAEMARELGVRLHSHVAESDAEDEYYRTGTGPLAERVRTVATRRVGILERGGTGLGAAELARRLGLLGTDSHIAHGVYLGPDGRRIMAETGTLVALCPRSNLTVGIDPPPVADYLAEGVPFAVGTDSLGSSPSLDLMEDVAMLRRLAVDGGYDRPDLDHRLLLAATLGGATALGLQHVLGSLEPGKRADLAVFELPGDRRPTERDAPRRLVEHGASNAVATVLAGSIR